ncbi:MAG: TetR/AcrR family transcriptional regulator [Terracidiphilus sp.]
MAELQISSVLMGPGSNKPAQLADTAIAPTARKARTGPKPALTRNQIARAAIAIADSEGLDAVSMQRLARAVSVTTMALYRYFSSKTELIELMIDIAGGPAPNLDALERGWRPRLAEWARQCSAIYRRHPWFLEATMTPGRNMGQNELSWLDAAFTILGRTELTAREQHKAFLVLIGHVRSSAEFALAQAKGRSASWEPAMRLGKYRDSYPALTAAVQSGAFAEPIGTSIDFGLECILSGIRAITRARR